MKIREMIRRSCYTAAVTVLCFGPSAFAQSKLANPLSAATLTRKAGVYMLNPIGDDWWNNKKKKKVAASEGGSAALYLLLAGLSCCGAMLLRSRRPLAEKSV
jgi:hypothetical protein